MSSMTATAYNGPDRRRSTEEERAVWRQNKLRAQRDHGDATRRLVWWAMGMLASLIVGVVLADRQMVMNSLFGGKPEASDISERDRREDGRRFERHIATAEATIDVLRQAQVEEHQRAETYRGSVDQRLTRLERKLDLLLLKQGIRWRTE